MENNIEKKYIPLANYFQASQEGVLKLSFSEIETIVGQKLPNAAYLNKSWWKKTKPPLQHFLAWANNGYFVSKVQPGYYVQFEKPQYQSSNYTNVAGQKAYTYIIRPAELDDARALVKLLQQLREKNSSFHYDALQTPDTAQSLRKRIATWNTKGIGQIFVAIVDGHIQCFVQIIGNRTLHLQHRAEISLYISPEYIHQNIDISLLEAAEKWAIQHKISRIELSTLKTNDYAIEGYKKSGLSVEGIRKNALYNNNNFYDELYMGKIL
ncbi:MAG: GNAT family N-acetyltransferase [Kurthia sp.]|nr:GNAT family N-acetyltransferase [Candidatus Kurthia equi]